MYTRPFLGVAAERAQGLAVVALLTGQLPLNDRLVAEEDKTADFMGSGMKRVIGDWTAALRQGWVLESIRAVQEGRRRTE